MFSHSTASPSPFRRTASNPIAAVVVVLSTLLAAPANGHGFLSSPVARNVRASNFPLRPAGATNLPQGLGHNNANRNAVHGICGDGPSGPQPFATPGRVVATYTAGTAIELEVRITAHHLGFFEFELCDSPDVSEDCFKRHQLRRAGCAGTDDECRVTWKPATATELSSGTVAGGAVYPAGAPVFSGDHLFGANFKMEYELPTGVTCDHCVIRWHYYTTNSCSGPSSGAEEFWNCADVAIVAPDGSAAPTAVAGTALAELTDRLLNTAPTSVVGRGNLDCSSFGTQLTGTPSWAFVNVGPAASYAAAMIGEAAAPGYAVGCAAIPGDDATYNEACLFQSARTISYHGGAGPAVTTTAAAATAVTTTAAATVTTVAASTSTAAAAHVVCVGRESCKDGLCGEIGAAGCAAYPNHCELRPASTTAGPATATDPAAATTTTVAPVATTAPSGEARCVGKHSSTFDVWCAGVGLADPTCASYPSYCELRPLRIRRQSTDALFIRGRVIAQAN